jgi:hypothetical protein
MKSLLTVALLVAQAVEPAAVPLPKTNVKHLGQKRQFPEFVPGEPICLGRLLKVSKHS